MLNVQPQFYKHTVCALNDEYSSFNNKPESESLLTCGVIPEALASRKGDSSDAISEVSGTAKLCTDEQELHRRHNERDECAQQH